MAVDPLSTATRSAKRNLLIVSTLAITYRAFDISIDKIPFSGVSITFNPGVFAFLLTAGLVYFATTFVLYYYIDIRNIEPTAHELGMTKVFHERVGLYSRRVAARAHQKISKLLPAGYTMSSAGDDLYKLFDQVEKNSVADAIRFRTAYDVSCLKLYHKADSDPRTAVRTVAVATDPDVFKLIATLMQPYLRFYWWTSRLNRLRFKRVRWTVGVIYPFRNYVVDGLLPLALASLAFAALYNIVDLHWLRAIAPER